MGSNKITFSGTLRLLQRQPQLRTSSVSSLLRSVTKPDSRTELPQRYFYYDFYLFDFKYVFENGCAYVAAFAVEGELVHVESG